MKPHRRRRQATTVALVVVVGSFFGAGEATPTSASPPPSPQRAASFQSARPRLAASSAPSRRSVLRTEGPTTGAEEFEPTDGCGRDLHEDSNEPRKEKGLLLSRREALVATATAAALSSLPLPSAAFKLPGFSLGNPNDPEYRPTKFRYDGTYKPAKRAMAYLVDTTIPPSLIPYGTATSERRLLKRLGQGHGTSKGAVLYDPITINNSLNKFVFGSINAVKETARAISASLEGDTANTAQGIEQPWGGIVTSNGRRKKRTYDASFVCFGVNYMDAEDAALACFLMDEMMRPRESHDDWPTALGLAFVPKTAQPVLDDYLANRLTQSDLFAALQEAGVSETTLRNQMPLLDYAKKQQQQRGDRFQLLALAPLPDDLQLVRREGLQNLPKERRDSYVADPIGFIETTQDPAFRLYTEKSLLRDYQTDKEGTTTADFFAERILFHEATATAAAQWGMAHPKSLLFVVAPIRDLRFLRGINGRIPRISKAVKPTTGVDDEAVTTVLLNPSAEETLSLSRFLRLEIGTAPENLPYQTKVSDYLWFSRMPKVNMLPRMMNPMTK